MIGKVEQWFQKNEKNTNRAVFISIPLIALIYSWKILFTGNNILPGGLDFPSYISANVVHRRDLLSGILPIWSNMHSYGVPEFSNPLTSLYYPPSLIAFLIFGIPTGLKITLYIHICMSGIFFWFFSKEIVENLLSRFFGSILYMLSGILAGQIFAGHFVNQIMTYPWLPLFMLTLYAAIREKDQKHVIFCSAALAVIFILGGYYMLWAGALMVLFGITNSVKLLELDSGIKFKVDWANIRLFAEIVALVLLFSAIKLIPVVLYSLQISRSFDPLLGSLKVSEIISAFIDSSSQQSYGQLTKEPYHFYESYAYLGIIPAILAVFSLFNKRTLSVYYLTLLIFIIWIQGFHTIFGFVHYIPLISNYRVPTRAFHVLAFVVIILAMAGFDWLYENFNGLNKIQQTKISSLIVIFIFVSFLEWGSSGFLGFLVSKDPPRDSISYFYIARDIFLSQSSQIIALIAGLIFLLIFFVVILPKGVYYLRQISNPGKTIMIIIVLFCSINLILVNRPLFDNVRNPNNSELVMRATKVINQDSNSAMKWTLLSGGLKDRSFYFELGFIDNNIPISNAYYSTSQAYNLQVSPSSFVLKNQTYSLHNYEITTHESERPSDILLDSFFAKEVYGNELLINESVYVYRNDNSLPDAFIIHENHLIQAHIIEYSSREIIVSVDRGYSGDIVVVKVTYHPGWTINGQKAINYQQMVAAQIKFSEELTVFKEDLHFRLYFEPLALKIGSFITLILSPVLVVILLKKWPRKYWNVLFRD